MISHKKSLITIFGHKHKIKNLTFFTKKFQQPLILLHIWYWSKITSKMRDKFWTKWQLWPKNVITQILQSLYNLISTLEVKPTEPAKWTDVMTSNEVIKWSIILIILAILIVRRRTIVGAFLSILRSVKFISIRWALIRLWTSTLY